jgi:hypothetical protein
MNQEEYLIKNTTREERVDIAKEAFAIASGAGMAPDEETLKIVKQYIDGTKELEEVQKEIIERAKK